MSELPVLDLPQKPKYTKLELKEDVDFLDIFIKIEKECETCFLFESLDINNSHSRYNIIGFSPEGFLRASHESLIWENKEKKKTIIPTKNPYKLLSEWLPQNIISYNYAGGLVGYLSYDACRFFEPILDLKTHPNFDVFTFALYTDGLIYDKMVGEVIYFHYKENRIDLVKKWIKSKPLSLSFFRVQKKGLSCTKKEHKEMVNQVIEEIYLGNTFQCQIGFQENYEWEGDLINFYRNLRKVNPSPHMYFMKFQEQVLVGASPELVFRLEQNEMESFPLAGTTKRGENSTIDMQLARELLNDPKEIAEHNMLIDLHRNDLGKMARFASVRVRHLKDIKKFSHVQHISSEVIGLLVNQYNMFSALGASFPAGTLSGAPKIESMKIIEKVENLPRGPYGGAIGHFGFNGNCTFAIPIRTLFVHGQQAFTRASGGIVYDSTAENEYLEIERKLGAIRHTLSM